uniref:DDE_Tnp_1_7 domain-containing protein n=1 Tax=Loa loa TaxID=7209 RepID=A0A1I7VDJ1_LOALO
MLDLDKTLDEETAADKCILRGSSISKEVEVVISDLMKISSYNLDAQQKFYDALSEVLTKDVPVAEVSSKYGIAVDAFQPYITEARVLLGQSPYSTSSNIRETSTELDSELPNGSRKYADGKNHFDEIFTNIELPLKDISGDTVFTTFVAVHPTNMAKDFSKHEKRYDTGNLLTKAYLLSSMTALILLTR